MKSYKKPFFTSAFLLITLLANFAMPIAVLADDETPPSTEDVTIGTSEEITSNDMGEENLDSESTPESETVSEILEQLPEDTQIIVLNEEGNVEPLATETAAETIIIGDPVWCPATLTAPTPGANGCTSSYGSFQDLITYLDTNEQAMAGTIWIESSYNSSVNDPSALGFNISGSNFTVMRDYGLTIQGGWNGVSGSSAIGAPSLFVGDSLYISNWVGDVTVNNITLDGTGATTTIPANSVYALLRVDTTGDVILSDIDARNSDSTGVMIYSYYGTQSITVTGTNNFSNNTNYGIQAVVIGDVSVNNITANNNLNSNGISLVSTNGNITVTGTTTANENGGNGLNISYSGSGNGNITLNGTNTFNGNNNSGLYINNLGSGNISLSNITANENAGGHGFELDGANTNNFSLTGTNIFNNNNRYGAFVYLPSGGEVTLENITASGNGDNPIHGGGGFFLFDFGTLGNISLTGTNIFNDNKGDGLTLFTYGSLTTENITAGDGNDANSTGNANGANLYSSGILTMGGINTFKNNNYYGLIAGSDAEVFMENITANGNAALGSYGYGMYVSSPANITLTGTNIFNDNYNDGLFVDFWGAGNFRAENVTANGNGISGTGNGVTLNYDNNYNGVDALFLCSQFSDNAGYGIDAAPLTGSLTLNDVIFSGNGAGDYNYGGSPIFGNDCKSTAKGSNGGSGLPLQVIPVNGGGGAEFDCELFAGTTFVLSNGDKVTFKCPIDGDGVLGQLKNDGLPGALPEGVEYVSGMQADQSPDGSDTPLNGLVIISFVIPQDMQGEDFAILYFDGSDWVDLRSAAFEDGRTVFNVGFAAENGYFEGVTNFSGNFILVKK